MKTLTKLGKDNNVNIKLNSNSHSYNKEWLLEYDQFG